MRARRMGRPILDLASAKPRLYNARGRHIGLAGFPRPTLETGAAERFYFWDAYALRGVNPSNLTGPGTRNTSQAQSVDATGRGYTSLAARLKNHKPRGQPVVGRPVTDFSIFFVLVRGFFYLCLYSKNALKYRYIWKNVQHVL